MKLEGLQQRPTIYIGESDHHGHTPLATEIDRPAAIAEFLSHLDELITESLVVLDDVDVVNYVGQNNT